MIEAQDADAAEKIQLTSSPGSSGIFDRHDSQAVLVILIFGCAAARKTRRPTLAPAFTKTNDARIIDEIVFRIQREARRVTRIWRAAAFAAAASRTG
jgi:hypothetical protein